MTTRRIVVAQTRLAVDPAGYRLPWRPAPGGPPPPHPGRPIKLPVGVVRWNNPSPTLTVVVKLTLTFAPGVEESVDEDGERAVWAEPVDPQPGLSGTRWDGDPALGKLVHPTDFVPFKRRADVLLTGHAYAHEGEGEGAGGGAGATGAGATGAARTVIRAAISVDGWSREIVAVAGASTDRIPLLPGYLKERDEAAAAAPTGPIASPLVVNPRRWHDPDFDFQHYNAASPLQRPPSIEPDAIIELARLSPRAERRTVLLPNLLPRVIVRPPDGGDPFELDMDCDTLAIDTDAETCTLLFRGDMPVESVETPRRRRLVVSLERGDDVRSLDDLLRELPRGLFYHAVEVEDVTPGAPAPPANADELRAARAASRGYPVPPLPAMPLARYTAVRAELAEGRASRADVLRAHGVDGDDWALEERAWPHALAEQGPSEGAALAALAGRLAVEAQDALAAPDEAGRTLADFARTSVLVERLGTTRGLAEARMSVPAWLRMKRRFRLLTTSDPNAGRELSRLLLAERTRAAAALPGPGRDEQSTARARKSALV